MRLVRFERHDGAAVWVNPEHVASVEPGTVEGNTCLILVHGLVVVRGAPADIARQLA